MSRKEYLLDKRNAEDIQNQIRKLAESYVPEWKFGTENPDVGSVIALIFAKQTEQNIKLYNQMLERCHAEFVNMLGISLLPAQPAGSYVVMSLLQRTIPGNYVPANTKLVCNYGDNPVIFETAYPIYVTSAVLDSMFMTLDDRGSIVKILGDIKRLSLIDGYNDIPAAEEYTGEESMKPFSLLTGNPEGVERNALVFYHNYMFDIENEQIFMKIKGEDAFINAVKGGEYILSYFTDEGFIQIKDFTTDHDVICFKKDMACKKIGAEGYSVLALEAVKPVKDSISFKQISFSSAGEPAALTYIGTGTTEFDAEKFRPFTDTLSMFEECFLSHTAYFNKPGALITLTFTVSFLTNVKQMTRQQEEDSLKVIKRKPRILLTDTMVDVYPEEIAIEYFNGNGWKRLICNEEYVQLFALGNNGQITLTFYVPKDWQELNGYGDPGRYLRMRLMKADNCYLIPATHHYPEISNLRVAYSYEERFEIPQKLMAISGTLRRDLSSFAMQEKSFDGFICSKYQEDALYFGFDGQMQNGPIGLFIEIDEKSVFMGGDFEIRYSTRDGFKPLKVIDGTDGLTRSGIMRFMPPEDMTAIKLEGEEPKFWLKIVDKYHMLRRKNISGPVIKQIMLNVTEVSNIETMAREDFYIDEVQADMAFDISAKNILDADVWVNEFGTLTKLEMSMLLQSMPERVHAEYDNLGNIIEFYVLWSEVENFSHSSSTDRYYAIDRLTGRISFGDGINVKIPRVTDTVSFYVIARSCDGIAGNVPENTISESLGAIDFIGSITNFEPAYGGSNLESIKNALDRGANIISSRKRLVTVNDYTREILAMSDSIDKVSCVVGRSIDNSVSDDLISMVILMKDFLIGSHSFERLHKRIKEHLNESCEMTIASGSLQIVEPIPIEISVGIWMKSDVEERLFEKQEKLVNGLSEFLNPVSNQRYHGWEIGVLPRKSQIVMKVNSIDSLIVIQKLEITGKYCDSNGIHEFDLASIPENPFFVCTSGEHRIHLL